MQVLLYSRILQALKEREREKEIERKGRGKYEKLHIASLAFAC